VRCPGSRPPLTPQTAYRTPHLMRRLGIILLIVGLAGFLVASSQRSSYESLEGQFKAAVSKEERARKDLWESARWLLLGVGVVGLVLVILPGKKN